MKFYLLSLLALLWGPPAHAQQPRPVFDQGPAAFHQAHLGQILFSATAVPSDAYASAERSDEGDCADKGLTQVSTLRAQADTYDAKGRAAARAGDVPAAQASFRAALAIDRGDATASAELQRLIRNFAAPTPTASSSEALSDSPSSTRGFT